MPAPTDSSYDSYWAHRGSSGNRYRYGVFLGWIPNGSTVLDAGCGDGFLGSRLLHEKQCIVTGMDVAQVALDKAQERGLTVVQGSLDQALPFADNSFDYVIASESIEHIVQSEAALKELYRVARRAVLISVPNTGFWRYRWQLLRGTFPKQWLMHPWEHIRFWTIRDFQMMTRGLGFQIRHICAGSGRRWLRDWWPSLFAEQVCYYIPKS